MHLLGCYIIYMKVGDLVRFEKGTHNDDTDRDVVEYGVVVRMSTTGHTTESAEVLFNDGELAWVGTQRLVVINESR